MACGETILDRALRLWEKSQFAFLRPVLAHPQPDEYELVRRIADEHSGCFDDRLIELLSSPSPVVVAYVLAVLHRMRSPALEKLPEQLFRDERAVTIPGCLFVVESLAQLARNFAEEARREKFNLMNYGTVSMYMPDPALAKQCIEVPPFGRLLRFDIYGLEVHQPRDDPYNAVVRELEKEGSHRNVFLVDNQNNPLWRIANYEQQPQLPDAFVDISCLAKPGNAKGVTFRGHIFEINLADRSLKKIGWTK